MRIELIKSGMPSKTAGWDIVGETEEERRILGSMRNMIFFGSEKQKVKYNGMSTFEEDTRYVEKLHFRTVQFIEIEEAEWRARREIAKGEIKTEEF
jgi:alpha-N-acetylglucosamine transferase